MCVYFLHIFRFFFTFFYFKFKQTYSNLRAQKELEFIMFDEFKKLIVGESEITFIKKTFIFKDHQI